MKSEESRKQIEEYFKNRIKNTRKKDIKKQAEFENSNENKSLFSREKLRIQKEQKWYKKTQNIIPLLTLILPIVISIIVTNTSKNTKELTILYSNPESLISSKFDTRENLYITYDSSEIKNISKFSIQIINSGGLTITKDDFTDGPIGFDINSKKKQNLKLLKVIRKDDADQQNSQLLTSSESENSFQYLPSLINKGDKIIIDVLFTNSQNIDLNVHGKINNGVIKMPILTKNTKNQLGFKTIILSINCFCKHKWIAIMLFMILFFFTGLSSLFQFIMKKRGYLDYFSVLGFFMTLTTSIVSISSLILIVFIIIY